MKTTASTSLSAVWPTQQPAQPAQPTDQSVDNSWAAAAQASVKAEAKVVAHITPMPGVDWEGARVYMGSIAGGPFRLIGYPEWLNTRERRGAPLSKELVPAKFQSNAKEGPLWFSFSVLAVPAGEVEVPNLAWVEGFKAWLHAHRTLLGAGLPESAQRLMPPMPALPSRVRWALSAHPEVVSPIEGYTGNLDELAEQIRQLTTELDATPATATTTQIPGFRATQMAFPTAPVLPLPEYCFGSYLVRQVREHMPSGHTDGQFLAAVRRKLEGRRDHYLARFGRRAGDQVAAWVGDLERLEASSWSGTFQPYAVEEGSRVAVYRFEVSAAGGLFWKRFRPSVWRGSKQVRHSATEAEGTGWPQDLVGLPELLGAKWPAVMAGHEALGAAHPYMRGGTLPKLVGNPADQELWGLGLAIQHLVSDLGTTTERGKRALARRLPQGVPDAPARVVTRQAPVAPALAAPAVAPAPVMAAPVETTQIQAATWPCVMPDGALVSLNWDEMLGRMVHTGGALLVLPNVMHGPKEAQDVVPGLRAAYESMMAPAAPAEVAIAEVMDEWDEVAEMVAEEEEVAEEVPAPAPAPRRALTPTEMLVAEAQICFDSDLICHNPNSVEGVSGLLRAAERRMERMAQGHSNRKHALLQAWDEGTRLLKEAIALLTPTEAPAPVAVAPAAVMAPEPVVVADIEIDQVFAEETYGEVMDEEEEPIVVEEAPAAVMAPEPIEEPAAVMAPEPTTDLRDYVPAGKLPADTVWVSTPDGKNHVPWSTNVEDLILLMSEPEWGPRIRVLDPNAADPAARTWRPAMQVVDGLAFAWVDAQAKAAEAALTA